MDIFPKMFDILLGYNTDISFENGDLMLSNGTDYLEREIYKLLITSPGDWKISPSIGCSPGDYTGEQNTKEVANKIENIIKNGILTTVYPAQFSVRAVPTGYETLLIFIDIYLQDTEIDTIPFEFSFINGIKKIDRQDKRITKEKSSQKYNINDITNLKRPNKYWSKIREEFIG